MAKKVDTINVGFRWKREVYEAIKEDADKSGVTLGAYLAMIAMQKHVEQEAMRMISVIPTDKLREMLQKSEE